MSLSASMKIYFISETYVITTSADYSKGVAQTVLNGINGWIACFSNLELKGYLEAGGLDNPNDVQNRNDLLEQAYNMGKNI